MEPKELLSDDRIEQLLGRLPSLSIGVLGDLFLDRYLDLDSRLTEVSIETGLDAYQVTGVRAIPGAAGTVVNNLVALGVGKVHPIAILGDDGEGYELQQALRQVPAVSTSGILVSPRRRTPAYTKPLLHAADRSPHELNRLDIKNRTPLPAELEGELLQRLHVLWPRLDALAVLDQVTEPECGVVTTRVREAIAELGKDDPQKLILADSRTRIGLFRNVALKPNRDECLNALATPSVSARDQLEARAQQLASLAGRAVFCTDGAAGILVVDATQPTRLVRVPAYRVTGPVDIVGAGDSTSAAIVSAVASGLTMEQAAAFGSLVASITIQQIGTTGTASPTQVRQRWRQVQSGCG